MSLEELPYVIKPHPQLVEKLTDQIKQEFDKNGLTLIQFHISNIDLPPEMDETLNRYWANHGRKLQPTEGFTPLSGYTAEEQLQIKIRQNIAGELSESLSRNRNRPNPFIDLQRTNVTDMITHLEGMLTQSQTDPTYLSPDAKQTIDNLLFTLRNYS